MPTSLFPQILTTKTKSAILRMTFSGNCKARQPSLSVPTSVPVALQDALFRLVCWQLSKQPQFLRCTLRLILGLCGGSNDAIVAYENTGSLSDDRWQGNQQAEQHSLGAKRPPVSCCCLCCNCGFCCNRFLSGRGRHDVM
jgi:hypothetical protein